MRRFRGTDLSMGLVAVVANIALVAGVVLLTTGRPAAEQAKPRPTPSSSTATKAPDRTSRPTATVTPNVMPASFLSADRDLTLAILGDGTGDENGEWVTVLGELAGASRRVTLRNLDPADPTQYAARLSYGRAGKALTIWNGSRNGALADYAARRLDFLVPTAPDLVLLSYGRGNNPSNVATQLDVTLTALRQKHPRVPVAVVLQAQDRDDAIGPTRAAIATWAKSRKLVTIDVAGSFAAGGNPNQYVSVVDPPSVNANGGRLWARTVYRALGGLPSQPTPTAGTAGPTTTTGTGTPVPPGPVISAPPAPAPRPTSQSPSPTGDNGGAGGGGPIIPTEIISPTPQQTTPPPADPPPTEPAPA